MDMRSSSTWGGRLSNLVAGDRFANLGKNPACPVGGFSVWTGLQGTAEVGADIAAYDSDMADLSRQTPRHTRLSRWCTYYYGLLSDP